jgi:integrase
MPKKQPSKPKYPHVEILDSDRCRWKILGKHKGQQTWLTSKGSVHPWEIWPGVVIDEGVRRLAAVMSSEAMQARTYYNLHGEMPPSRIAVRKVPTLGELAAEWHSKVIPATCKAVTVQDYRYLLGKHILPDLGDRAIDGLTRMDIRLYLTGKLNGGLSASTVRHIQNALSGVFALALDGEIIKVNPAQRLGRLARQKPRDEAIRPFNQPELETLLDKFREVRPHFYPFVFLLARTGMRAGEALGLTWDDLDLDARTATVARTRSRGSQAGDGTKTGQSRVVDLTPLLVRELRILRRRNAIMAMRLGLGALPELVFLNTLGQPINDGVFRNRAWKPTLKAANLAYRRVHDLRHTYASLMLAAGAPILYVSKQLGHASPKMTLDVYSSYLPQDGPRAVDALDKQGEMR